MKLRSTLLGSAITLALSGLLTVSAAQASNAELSSVPVSKFGIGSSGTTATFSGGITNNGGASFLQEIPANTSADFQARINVAAADIGKTAGLMMVLRVSDSGGTGWFQRAPSGEFVSWDTKVGSLASFETRNLQALETVNVSAIAKPGDNLEGTEISVFFAYQVAGEPMTYSFNPVRLNVAQTPASTCPAGTTFTPAVVLGGKNLCVLSGTYTEDLHLTSNFDYVLSGAVFIGGDNTNSAELTIDAGITTFGESGSDFLVINRGSKIHVNGTPNKPVTMTSANDATATSSTRGQWGGIIINGNAPINGCSTGTVLCEAQGEGSTGLFGGNDAEDDSGNLNYLVVKYAGFQITQDNELNGIALQGVGSKTLIDYAQVHNNADDGIEFFGGTANARHLVLTGNSDDSLDWTLGWRGKVQYAVVFQTDVGDQGIEADNNASNRDSLPRSQPQISNISMIGNIDTDVGMLLREGTGGNISNAVVSGFGEGCVDIDQSATFINAGTSATELSGGLTLTNTLFDCDINFIVDSDDGWSVEAWFNNQADNTLGTASFTNTFVNTSAINAFPAAQQTDNFFDQTDYIGGIKDTTSDWTSGWIFIDWE
ncbi:MAG: hypothetical protein RQ899_06025 [Pseudomonadales bacterium]|nr:hypothetical protein [Pseudomonadales bacterium]